MTRQEVVNTRYGELLDLISCLSVYEGAAELKPKEMSFEDIMKLE